MARSQQHKNFIMERIAISSTSSTEMESGLRLMFRRMPGAQSLEAKVYAQVCATMIVHFAPGNTSGTDATCMVWESIWLIWRKKVTGMSRSPNLLAEGADIA